MKKAIYYLVVFGLALALPNWAQADPVLMFDLFVVDRATVEIFSESQNGQLVFNVGFGSTYSHKEIRLLYKEPAGSNAAKEGLKKLQMILRDENVIAFGPSTFETDLGLKVEKILK